MSGTAYSSCPRCKILAARFDAEIQKKVDEFYGKCSAQQFRLIQKQAKKVVNPYTLDSSSLREDYSADVDDQGTLSFGYYGECCICGYTVKGSYETNVDPVPTDAKAEDRAYEEWEKLHIVETDE